MVLTDARARVLAATAEEERTVARIAILAYGVSGRENVTRQHLLWLRARGLVDRVRRGEYRRAAAVARSARPE